jgi:hypothetical protein
MKSYVIAIQLILFPCIGAIAEAAAMRTNPLAQSAAVSVTQSLSSYIRNVGLLYIETVEGAGNNDQLQTVRAIEDRIDINSNPQTDKGFYELGLKRLRHLAEIRLSNSQTAEAQIHERLANSERKLESIQEGIRNEERQYSEGLVTDKAHRAALANSLNQLRQGQSESQAASEAHASYKADLSNPSSGSNMLYAACDTVLRRAIKTGEYNIGDLEKDCEVPAPIPAPQLLGGTGSSAQSSTWEKQIEKACPSGTTMTTTSYGAACLTSQQAEAQRRDAEASSWHTQKKCLKNHFVWRDGSCHTQ